MALPTRNEVKLLHKKYAPSQKVFEEIWQHSEIIRDIAFELIDNNNLASINKKLVETGCLLHDIGVYHLYSIEGILDEENYIQHGVLGYKLLKDNGFEEQLCRFASHHTGVGLTAEEIARNDLPLPKEDLLADTEEERLVMYSDKFHSKMPSQFNTFEWYKKHVMRFGNDKVKEFKQMAVDYGIPDIKSTASLYRQNIR